MKKKNVLSLALGLALCAGLLSGCGGGESAEETPDAGGVQRVESLKIAFSPYADADIISESTEPLEALLKAKLLEKGYDVGEVDMTVGTSYTAVGEALSAGSADLGFISGGNYVLFSDDCDVLLTALRYAINKDSENPADWNDGTIEENTEDMSTYYRCIVLAPASAQEMCDLAFTAFDLAEKYRIVVYMLTDGVIGQTMETVTLPEPLPRREVPEWALDVSRPRTNMISSIYLETDDLEALNLRLQAKYRRIEEAEQRCELYQAEDAEVLLVGYGISGRLARTAVDELRARGIRAGLLRPITLFPFPVNELRRLRAKQLIAVEMSCGQMIDDVKLAINCDRPVHLINRMGGNIPGTGEIVERTIKLISAEEK